MENIEPKITNLVKFSTKLLLLKRIVLANYNSWTELYSMDEQYSECFDELLDEIFNHTRNEDIIFIRHAILMDDYFDTYFKGFKSIYAENISNISILRKFLWCTLMERFEDTLYDKYTKE